MPTSVGSLRCNQLGCWGAISGYTGSSLYASCAVGMDLFLCQLGVCLLFCRHLRAHHFSFCPLRVRLLCCCVSVKRPTRRYSKADVDERVSVRCPMRRYSKVGAEARVKRLMMRWLREFREFCFLLRWGAQLEADHLILYDM